MEVQSKPVFLPAAALAECFTFRDACRLAWKHRQNQGMTLTYFAMLLQENKGDVSRYFGEAAFDEQGRRMPRLPADLIPEAERLLGNHAISQFLTRKGLLHLMEEMAWSMSNT